MTERKSNRGRRPRNPEDDASGKHPLIKDNPDLFTRYYREQLEMLIDGFQRYREIRLRKQDPGLDLDAALPRHMLLAIADRVGVRKIPSEQDGHEIAAWLYWMELIQVFQRQAEAISHGLTITMTRPGDNEVLGSINAAAADLIRQLLEGDIPEEFLAARRAPGLPSASARQRDALHKISAVARLAADGVIPGLTSRGVLEQAGQALGLTWEGVRKAAQRAGTNRLVDRLRAIVLRLPPAERQIWVTREVERSVQEYLEWDIFRSMLSH
jgi:hypothetical protein